MLVDDWAVFVVIVCCGCCNGLSMLFGLYCEGLFDCELDELQRSVSKHGGLVGGSDRKKFGDDDDDHDDDQ